MGPKFLLIWNEGFDLVVCLTMNSFQMAPYMDYPKYILRTINLTISIDRSWWNPGFYQLLWWYISCLWNWCLNSLISCLNNIRFGLSLDQLFCSSDSFVCLELICLARLCSVITALQLTHCTERDLAPLDFLFMECLTLSYPVFKSSPLRLCWFFK